MAAFGDLKPFLLQENPLTGIGISSVLPFPFIARLARHGQIRNVVRAE
jgi:hypothetical protein